VACSIQASTPDDSCQRGTDAQDLLAGRGCLRVLEAVRARSQAAPSAALNLTGRGAQLSAQLAQMVWQDLAEE
jgi:hypothetical protein